MTHSRDSESHIRLLPHHLWISLIAITVFAAAFGIVEATVVVYLRDLYYPAGFSLPLKPLPMAHALIEIAREAATLVMLAAASFLGGQNRWQRFSVFMIAFGVWDIAYYAWLKLILGWPASVFDWDVLFLIPLPWIGPVIAPILISALLVAAGVFILRAESRFGDIRIPRVAWVVALAATALILYSFMWDTEATLRFSPPRPYLYWLLFGGILLYGIGLLLTLRQTATAHRDRSDGKEKVGSRRRGTTQKSS